MEKKKLIEIFCDGACRGNPGPGGWGTILRYGAKEKELNGYKAKTTNNEMELIAATEGLKALNKPSDVTVTTDSKYVIQGITSWIHGWKKNNWKTSAKKPVKNKELWEALDTAAHGHSINWVWVKGHNGHPENERADGLANLAIDQHR